MVDFVKMIKEIGLPIMVVIAVGYYYIDFENLEIKTTFTKIIKKFL